MPGEAIKQAESDLRGVLGLDPDASARMLGQRMKVRIASDDATALSLARFQEETES